jgi:predicted GNAT family N-acyltransferase
MTFEKIDNLTEEQIEELYGMYQSEWWTKGREISDIRRMLEHSSIIVAFCDRDNKRMVAFARILTDYVYKALILDVIVHSSYRSQHLGRKLMDSILEHPSLESVRHLELYCLPEMVPFYRKWGFADELGELCFMRRDIQRGSSL